MRTPLLYILTFFIVLLFQLLVFENVNLGPYIHPLAYVALILLLPMDMRPALVLAAGLLVGVLMDFFTGDAGLHTIATLPVAFLRSVFMPYLIGRDQMKDMGAPVASAIGTGRFLRYSLTAILLHAAIYFSFESLSAGYFHLTLIHIALSAVVTLVLVWAFQLMFSLFYRRVA